MNEETRKKYQLLKEKNKIKARELKLENNILYKECIASLKECNVLSLEESKVLYDQFKNNFSITSSGCIKWKCVKENVVIECISEISHMVNVFQEYYILWDQIDLPCVSCKLITIIENIEDVLAVSFNTWLLSKDKREVIEFHHEGKIIYGKTSIF